jgi:myo-inositol 2-dehydrogenase/D-chiro-inositol 1-dehydrogenase
VVNVALIGAGGIAGRHAEAFAGIENARIVAVVDTIQPKADQLAGACGATAYPTVEACLPHADVAYILTPPSSHRELALQAIRAGKHVLVEKPIASEISDAEAMVEAARQTKVKLMVGFNMRFRRGFVRLKEAVQSGSLGQPIHFWSQRLGMGVGAGPNWRTTPGLLCGMSVESLSHDIDLLRWLVGEVIDVRANVSESRPELPGFDDNANVVCTLAKGGTALIHASWSSHLGRNSRGVIGTQGTAMVAGSGLWNLDQFHIKTTSMKYERIDVLNDKLDVQSYRDESRHFLDCVQNDRQPLVTGKDGLAALRISHAILASHRERQVVSLGK